MKPPTDKPANAKEWLWLAGQNRQLLPLHCYAGALLICATLLSLVDPLIIRWLIDDGLRRRIWTPAAGAIGAFAAIQILRYAALYGGTILSFRTVQHLTLQLRRRLAKKLFRLDGAFYDSHPVGELSQRFEQDIDYIAQTVSDIAPSLLRTIVAIIVTVTIMLLLDWKLTCIVLPFLPFISALRSRFASKLSEVADVCRKSAGHRISLLHELLTGIVSMQVLNAIYTIQRKYGHTAITNVRDSVNQRSHELLYTLGSFAGFSLCTALLLGAGSWQVIHGAMTLGMYVAFYSYLLRLFDPFSVTVDMYSRLKRCGSHVRHVIELDKSVPAVCDSGTRNLSGVVDVTVEDISFCYSRSVAVLNHLQLRLQKGDRLAIVGRSGIGKSTLAKLLVRLYDPQRGAILMDGINIRDVSLKSLRKHVSVVSQREPFFQGTIYDNLLLPERGQSQLDLEAAAYFACFDQVLQKFPRGWQHKLGPGGVGLSEGERQRLAILRTLLRDRDVLVLDEATAALDALLEQELLERLREYTKTKIALIITHRASTARWANSILLIDAARMQIVGPKDLDDEYLSTLLKGNKSAETSNVCVAVSGLPTQT